MLGFVVVLALSLPFVINQVLKQQDVRQRADSAPAISLNFSPQSNTTPLAVGKILEVNLLLNTAPNEDIGALHFILNYDKDRLEAPTVTNQNTGLKVIQAPPSTDGKYEATMVNINASPMVTGTNLNVITFRFVTKAAGTAQISIGQHVQATAATYNTYVPVNNNAGIVGTYTIAAAQTLISPTETVAGSPTPQPTGTVRYCGGNDHASCEIGFYSCYINMGRNVGKTCVSASGENNTYNCIQCVYVTPTPTGTQSNATILTCGQNGTNTATFDMKSPISATSLAPISNLTYSSGSWCAWAATDTVNSARCPLQCPRYPAQSGGYPFTLASNNLSFISDFDPGFYSDNSGSCTYSYSCAATTSATPTVTASPSPTPSPTPTPTTAPTPLPTSTPIPTPTAGASETVVKVAVTLPGIGNTVSGDNNAPHTTTRQVNAIVYDAQNAIVPSSIGVLIYNSTNGKYEGQIGVNVTSTTSTSYRIKLKLNNTLFKFIPGIITIIPAATTNFAPAVELVSGDLTGASNTPDNSLDILDYNLFQACYRGQPACTTEVARRADFNDNGVVNGDDVDANILSRGFYIRNGD